MEHTAALTLRVQRRVARRAARRAARLAGRASEVPSRAQAQAPQALSQVTRVTVLESGLDETSSPATWVTRYTTEDSEGVQRSHVSYTVINNENNNNDDDEQRVTEETGAFGSGGSVSPPPELEVDFNPDFSLASFDMVGSLEATCTDDESEVLDPQTQCYESVNNLAMQLRDEYQNRPSRIYPADLPQISAETLARIENCALAHWQIDAFFGRAGRYFADVVVRDVSGKNPPIPVTMPIDQDRGCSMYVILVPGNTPARGTGWNFYLECCRTVMRNVADIFGVAPIPVVLVRAAEEDDGVYRDVRRYMDVRGDAPFI
jgi:hypothetical protein